MKKTLITLSIFCLIAVISCPVFASNIEQGAENTLNGIRDGVQNMVNDAGNSIGRAKDGISNVITDGENAVNNMTNNDDNNDMNNYDNTNSNTMNNGTDDYTASRTASATDITNTNNATVWTVLAIAAIIIIALVWYYTVQSKNDRD